MLFDEMQRTETRAKRERESTFEYLNASARDGIAAARQVLEQWFESYPEAGKADLRARFRSRKDAQHQSAFWELYLHELFSGLGFTLEPHPNVDGSTNHPDFLVKEGDAPKFYLEAVVAGLPSAKDAGADARLAEVFDLVNRMKISEWFLQVEYCGTPDTPPPVKQLRKELEDWLSSQDITAIDAALKEGNWQNLPRFEWQYEGLTLAFTPSPKSPEAAANPESRPIGIMMGEAYQINTDEDIRRVVEAKANKYGALSLPLVVAVDVVNEHCDDFDIKNALFGTETIVVNRTPDGSFSESGRRLPNGVWFGKNGPRNKTVSAVLVGSKIHTFSSGSATPLLIHHPYPNLALTLPSHLLPELIPDATTRKMNRKDGRSAKEFLRLPDPWPPDE